MRVRRLAVSVRILAMVQSRGCVLLRLFVVAVIVIMGSLAVMMRRCFMVRRRIVMMFTRWVLHFVCHGEVLLPNRNSEAHDESRQRADTTLR